MTITGEFAVNLILLTAGFLFQHFIIIAKIQSRLSTIETKTELFWKCIENNVVNMLKTYPTHVPKDTLLDKLSENELQLDEAVLLRTILQEEMRIASQGKKLAYVLGLSRLAQVIHDLKQEEIAKQKKKQLWKIWS